jgi:hypothetical protein
MHFLIGKKRVVFMGQHVSENTDALTEGLLVRVKILTLRRDDHEP